MKIMLFGGSGMVGTSFQRIAKRLDMHIKAPSHENIDILDLNLVRKTMDSFKPDAVINCAAKVGIDPCERNPAEAYMINSQAARNLALITEENNAIFVQPSSHAVFSGTKDTHYLESDPPRIMNVYAGTKLLAENWAVNLCAKHYVTRFPTLFGRRKTGSQGFVEKMLAQLIKGKDVRVAEDKLDSPTYADDAAEASLKLILNKNEYGIYHIANSGVCSYFDLIYEAATLIQSQGRVHPAKDADFPSLAYKPVKTALASHKLEPLRDWQSALIDYIKEERKSGSL